MGSSTTTSCGHSRAPRVRPLGLSLLGAIGGLAALLIGGSPAHAAPPSNDDFANAQVLTGQSPTATGSTVDATRELGEPNHAGYTTGKSIWYRWTAPVVSPYTQARVSLLGSDFDSTAAVYTGASLATLVQVAFADDFQGKLQTVVDFVPVPGTTYYIAVDGATDGGVTPTGHVQLAISDLGATGQIEGTVTGPGGAGVGGVCVWAVDDSGNDVRGWARTASDGGYVLYGVPVGLENHVVFRNCGTSNVAGEFYNNVETVAGAADIAVTVGVTTSNVNAQLATGATVTGTISSADPGALNNVCVVATKVAGGDLGAVRAGRTNALGQYSINGLDGGSYSFEFASRDPDHCASANQTFLPVRYDDPGDPGTDDPVAATEGSTTSGINAPLAVPGAISGMVTKRTDSTPLEDICVRASNSGFTSSVVDTAADGTYTIPDVPAAGNYVVRFEDCHAGSNAYNTQYWNNKTTQASATHVVVTPGQTTEDIDASMYHVGSIAGSVKDPNGNPRANACARLFHNDVQLRDLSVTATGTFTFTDVVPGDYKVELYRCAAGLQFQPEFWDDQATIGSATVVTVGDGQAVTGIDAVLTGTGNGRIVGTVTNQSGTPLAGICVTTGINVNTTTAADGTYVLADLTPGGGYTVEFNECDLGSRNLLPASVGGQTVVTGTTTVANGQMATGGQISGRVTDTNGDPAFNVCVESDSGPWEVFTDAQGYYTLSSLPTDTYILFFEDCDEIYQDQWYDGVTDPDDATPISVTAGQTTSGIDVEMIRNGTISGLVTNEAGTPLKDICVTAYASNDGSTAIWVDQTAADGTYMVGNITSSGDYVVQFDNCDSGLPYGDEYYNNKLTFASATRVPVTFGIDSPGIDAVLQSNAPVNTSWPPVTGQMYVGHTLTAGTGTWDHEPAQFTYEWQRCDQSFHCVPANDTDNTFLLTQADVDHFIMVNVTASNSKGSTVQSSGTGGIPVAGKPVSTASPVISGSPVVGATLTTTTGTWTGSPTSYAYQWARCDTSITTCTPIGGATANSYQTTGADLGARLRVAITATNPAGSATRYMSTDIIGAPAPVEDPSTNRPVISGSLVVGGTLTTTTGTWTGSPTSYSYQWARCDTALTTCTPIGGATANSYQTTGADLGARLRVAITATNSVGSTTRYMPTDIIGAPTPVEDPSTNRPVISGSLVVGATLTTTTGTWTGSPTGYSYQWLRCDTALTTCTPIGGATANSYLLTNDDAGARLRVAITATNTAGSTTRYMPTDIIGAPTPVEDPSTNRPVISGSLVVGATLTTTTGTWTGSPTGYSYQWLRCDTSVSNCSAIPGATAISYLLTNDDAGARLRVAITATNAIGSGTRFMPTGIIGAPAPVEDPSTNRPVISGSLVVGATVSTTTGTWTGSPTSYSYQWFRCDASVSNCVAISGATASSYLLTNDDAGARLRVAITATNAIGSGTRYMPTGIIGAPTPVEDEPGPVNRPVITGALVSGSTLSTTNGTWTGSPTSYAYQWFRCDTSIDNCVAIPGATASSYLLTNDDAGARLRVAVTATNATGSTTRYMPTGIIGAPTPVEDEPGPVNRPVISGALTVGSTLSTTNGTWTGSPTSYAYQWFRCDTSVSNCVAISGATASSYLLTSDDLGTRLRVAVTAANATGSTTRYMPTGVIS